MTVSFAAPQHPRKPHLIALDGLRGVAAICVLMLHWFEGNGSGLFHYSLMAVDFFFLLSGFVIAYSYEERLRDGLPLSTFFATRFVRLYPMIFLGVLLGVTREALKQLTETHHIQFPELMSSTLLNFLMVPRLDAHANLVVFSLNIALWSLFFEFLAYLLYAAIYVRTGKWLLLLTIALAVPGVLAWLMTTFERTSGNFVMPLFENTTVQSLSRVLFSYLLGLCLYRYRAHIPTVPAVGFFALAAGAAAVFALPLHALPTLTNVLILAMISPLVVLSASRTTLGAKGKAIGAFLGDISYPLYVVHTPLMWSLCAVFKKLLPAVPVMLWGWLILPIILILSFACLKVYDEPIRKFLTDVLVKRLRRRDMRQQGKEEAILRVDE